MYKNESNKSPISYHQLNVANFLEEFSPIEIPSDIYEEVTSKQLEENESTARQYCDERYQRKYGAWTHEMKCNYIKSVFQNQIYTPIVLHPITDKERRKQNIPSNIKYACLDGQHRSNVVADFVCDKFGFTGTFVVDSKEYSHVNLVFSKMTEREKKIFLNRTKINVGVINAKCLDLRQCFISINDGEALNSQEKRNAIDCYMSEWTRKQSDNHEVVFKQLSKVSTKIHRMADREFISKVLLSLENLYDEQYIDHTDATLNAMYNNYTESSCELTKYVSDNLFASLKGVAETMRRTHGCPKIKIYNFWFYTLCHFFLTHKTNEEVDTLSIDPELFWRWCDDRFDTMYKDSEMKFRHYQDLYDEGKISKGDYTAARNKTFHVNSAWMHKSNSFKTIVDLLAEEFDGDWNKMYEEYIEDTHPSELREVV